MHLAGSFSYHIKQGCCFWHRKPEVKLKTPRTGSSAALPVLYTSNFDPGFHFQSQIAALDCQEEVVWAGFALVVLHCCYWQCLGTDPAQLQLGFPNICIDLCPVAVLDKGTCCTEA